MLFENDSCPVCYYEYEITNEDQDDYDKVCKYIPICGHKLCVECRDEIVFCGNACCPICRAEWENDFYDDDNHLEYPENVNIDYDDDDLEYTESVNFETDTDSDSDYDDIINMLEQDEENEINI